jgi:ribosomal protein S18 acetylase RimI-like enzyme
MLEPATEADHAAIVALVNQAYRGRGGELQSWNVETDVIEGERTTLAQMRADLAARPSARLMVHKDADVLLASVWLEPRGAADWYLGLLAIRPDLQARGLGRRMLDACDAYVAAHQGARVTLSVLNVRKALIAWYERRGYVRTGGIEPYPYGDTRFGRPLRDDLAFVTLAKALSGSVVRSPTSLSS